MTDAALTQPDLDEISGLPASTPLCIELPLASWRLILAHLGRGSFAEVSAVFNAICTQGDAQLFAAQRKAGIPVGQQRPAGGDAIETTRKH